MKPYLLFSILFLIAGCSSNSDSAIDTLAANESDFNESDSQVVNPDSVESNTVAQNPLAQPTIRVDFGITVPAYRSDSLQVKIAWGERETNVQWVGDEYWTATIEYPTDTERLLSVTFYDNNGAIVLGSFEQSYTTGTNAAEAFEITADQFNTSDWDADEDGTSNLRELIAGTDPIQIDVRDDVSVHYSVFTADSFSQNISAERPYLYSFFQGSGPITEGGPRFGLPVIKADINIDEHGDGSYYRLYQRRPSATSTRTATRTNTGNSVTWEGEWNVREGWDVDSWDEENSFTTQISIIDEGTRSYVGKSKWLHYISAGYSHTASWRSEYDLTGSVEEGTGICTPIAGTIVTTLRVNEHHSLGQRHVKTTITKETTDPIWEVTAVDVEDGTIRSQYYARNIKKFFYRGSYPANGSISSGTEVDASFQCEFSDW